MKRNLILVALLTALLPGLAGAGMPEGTSYGKGVTIEEPVAIETLLGKPDDYVGKTIRVDGVITGVCKKRGCWMQVTDSEGRGVRVKVEDGVIVFPYTSMGHKAAAEGVFEAIKLSPEQVAARAAHQATEKAAEKTTGESCDNAEEGAGAGSEKKTGCAPDVRDDTIYLLRGSGAIIKS